MKLPENEMRALILVLDGSSQVGLDNMLGFLMHSAAIESGGFGKRLAHIRREIRQQQFFVGFLGGFQIAHHELCITGVFHEQSETCCTAKELAYFFSLTCSHAMPPTRDTAKPVTVRLTDKELKRLDALAAKSGMTRHRYMSFVLDRAMASGLVVKEKLEYAESSPH